jgi:N4-gp56 family major capsid protein
MPIKYGTGSTNSSVGLNATTTGQGAGTYATGQLSGDFYYQKKALIELVKEQYFSQLASVTSMPKNMGKTIKQYLYIPMLDDRNLNDQGIDAAGVVSVATHMNVTFPAQVVIADASAAAAVTAINANINTPALGVETVASAGAGGSGGSGLTLITMTKLSVRYLSVTQSNAVIALAVGAVASAMSGNLYGSSKDIGAISGKLPSLSESGGRVNKVGFKRKELTGTFQKFGFFDEYTQESVDFDSDAELTMHINREMLRGANEITEDALQVDLINSAGVNLFAGSKTANRLMVGTSNDVGADLVTYTDLMRMSITLDTNRCPKKTTVISGSRMVDTRVLPASRVMYIGSELLPTFKAMKDLHNNPAFISVEKYAAGGMTLNGEVGSVDQFRLVVVPEMTKWAGAGAPVGAVVTYYSTGSRFDVFPILVVGDESFTTIGFQTDGKSVKFSITHKPPGREVADRNDPYGELGFMSIKWYYGFMLLRPERIALLRTVAKL